MDPYVPFAQLPHFASIMATDFNIPHAHVIDMESILLVETSTPSPRRRSFSPPPIRRHRSLTIHVVSSHDDDVQSIQDISDSDFSDDEMTEFSMHPSGHCPQLRLTRKILFPTIAEETKVKIT